MLRSNPIIPRGRQLIAIGYKYNMQKVLYFIVTEETWITKSGITYLSKYHFYNVAIHPVDCPLFMYKFLGSVNEIGSHNKSRQSGLALEKFWVTQCG